jgi:radical SAM protein with 4Fe4S-binding SPASM domain
LHCISSAGRVYKKELSKKEIFKIIEEAKKEKAFTIGITGGEPFLRNDIFEIIDKIYNSGLELIITTNGTLVNKSILERIKNKVSLIRISIDHFERTKHDYFRGVKGSFQKTISSIRLIQKYKDYFQLTTMTVISNFNFKNIRKIINFLEKLGVKSANIFLFVPGGRGKKRKDEFNLSCEQIKLFCELIKKEKQNRKKITIHASNPLMSILEDKDRFSRCPAAFTSCFITENGDVLPCPYFYSNKNKKDSIKKTKLKNIWLKSPRFIALRKEENLGLKCKKCDFKKTCFGGCRAGAFVEYNTIKKPDPMCWL